MKHTFKKLLAALVLTAFAAPSFAVTYTDSNQTIASVTTYTFGTLITLVGDGANTNNCSVAGAAKFAFIDTTNTLGRTQLASVLAAHVSNKPITLGLISCRPWGAATMPVAYRVAF
ncbi:MAG: hypothetical protein V3U71_13765 [Cocleimonas sp.]